MRLHVQFLFCPPVKSHSYLKILPVHLMQLPVAWCGSNAALLLNLNKSCHPHAGSALLALWRDEKMLQGVWLLALLLLIHKRVSLQVSNWQYLVHCFLDWQYCHVVEVHSRAAAGKWLKEIVKYISVVHVSFTNHVVRTKRIKM